MFEDNYKQRGLRNKLVKILQKKGISEPAILAAIAKVPRHMFFDNALLEHAYQDKAFPIGEGQTISQPYTVAFQTERLQIQPGDRVLEIGTGSGWERELPVFTAIVRQIDHYGGHVGQIVYLAKWMKGPDWKTLSIARGESKAYVPLSSWLEGKG